MQPATYLHLMEAKLNNSNKIILLLLDDLDSTETEASFPSS